jgi:hypothetical protein
MAPLGDRPVWKKLWKCNILKKNRVFTWKAISNALATKENKKRRHMHVSGLCRICGHESEDTHHALVRCPHAAALWAAMYEIWSIPKMPTSMGRADWLESWLEVAPMDMCCRILMIAWRA